MATYNKFNVFVADVANGKHNLGSDTLKAMLTNTLPVATNAVLTDLTEITPGNGYSAGGSAISLTSSTQTSGVYKGIFGAVVFTATGAVGPFRYLAVYNSTAAGKNLIGWFDYGSAISLANTETFTFTPDATNGLLELT